MARRYSWFSFVSSSILHTVFNKVNISQVIQECEWLLLSPGLPTSPPAKVQDRGALVIAAFSRFMVGSVWSQWLLSQLILSAGWIR